MQSTRQHLSILTSNHLIKKGLLLTLEQPGSLEDDGWELPEQQKQMNGLHVRSPSPLYFVDVNGTTNRAQSLVRAGHMTFWVFIWMCLPWTVWNWASSRINRNVSKLWFEHWDVLVGCFVWICSSRNTVCQREKQAYEVYLNQEAKFINIHQNFSAFLRIHISST